MMATKDKKTKTPKIKKSSEFVEESKEVERFKEANQKSNRKFRRLLNKEVIPLIVLASTLVLCYQYKTQIENLVIGEGRFGLEALPSNSVRFIAKRLAGLLKYQY